MNRTDLIKQARAAADRVLEAKGYLSAVDVLLAMGRLSKADYERWRFRQVPHLEKILPGSLNEHAFFCRELRAHARDLKLKPSGTVYTSWGKGRRQPLRFSKYGDAHVEELFSTHYVSAVITESQKARRTQILGPVSATQTPARVPPSSSPNTALGPEQNSAQTPPLSIERKEN